MRLTSSAFLSSPSQTSSPSCASANFLSSTKMIPCMPLRPRDVRIVSDKCTDGERSARLQADAVPVDAARQHRLEAAAAGASEVGQHLGLVAGVRGRAGDDVLAPAPVADARPLEGGHQETGVTRTVSRQLT